MTRVQRLPIGQELSAEARCVQAKKCHISVLSMANDRNKINRWPKGSTVPTVQGRVVLHQGVNSASLRHVRFLEEYEKMRQNISSGIWRNWHLTGFRRVWLALPIMTAFRALATTWSGSAIDSIAYVYILGYKVRSKGYLNLIITDEFQSPFNLTIVPKLSNSAFSALPSSTPCYVWCAVSASRSEDVSPP